MKSGSWASYRAGAETPDNDLDLPGECDFLAFIDRMFSACEHDCLRVGEPDANSGDCSCAPCRLAYWWDRADNAMLGLLYAGLEREGGFPAPAETEDASGASPRTTGVTRLDPPKNESAASGDGGDIEDRFGPGINEPFCAWVAV